MAKARDAFCDGCGHTFSAVPKRSFLGFHLFTCPACGSELRYPLASGYRILYTVVAVLTVSATVLSVIDGHIMMPGLRSGLMIVGLVKDHFVRRELKAGALARAAIGPAPSATDQDITPR